MMAKCVRQQPGAAEVVERRHQQALGQVAAGAEDAPWRRVGGGRARRRVVASAWMSARRRRRPSRHRPCGFDMAAEAEAHGREHLLAEGVLLARAEAGDRARRTALGRHRLLDRRLDRPAALAGIVDVAGELRRASGPRRAPTAVRSSSQDEITLPRRQTSAMSAMLRSKRSSSGRSRRSSCCCRMSKPSA